MVTTYKSNIKHVNKQVKTIKSYSDIVNYMNVHVRTYYNTKKNQKNNLKNLFLLVIMCILQLIKWLKNFHFGSKKQIVK